MRDWTEDEYKTKGQNLFKELFVSKIERSVADYFSKQRRNEAIIDEYKSGYITTTQLAEAYGLKQSQVAYIIKKSRAVDKKKSRS